MLNRQQDRTYVWILTGLLLLFCFRVAAQLIQVWFPVDALPPFEAWASGAVPYWLLCMFQVLIIIICSGVVWRIYRGSEEPSWKTGRVLLLLGGVYWGVMCVRLIIGLAILPDHFWFGATLPSLFHLVLASFILVYGRFHMTAARDMRSNGMTGVG